MSVFIRATSKEYPKFQGEGQRCEFLETKQCKNKAMWIIKPWSLCEFHKGFMLSTDYSHTSKAKKLTDKAGER